MGLHEAHAGQSYLGRETVNCLRVTLDDAEHDRDNAQRRQHYESDSAFHQDKPGLHRLGDTPCL